MLPDRAARAFPLLLLGLLAGMALLLDRATNLPYFSPPAGSRDPDLTINRFVATGYGPDGKPLYKLTASGMRHYPHDDHSEFADALLVRTLPGEPTLTISAEKARITEGGDRVFFEQDVRMHRTAAAGVDAMTLNSSRLQLDITRGLASSDAPADMVSGGNRMRSTGFDYDHPNTRLNLRSNVSLYYAPPQR
ncbi:hypothetical protein GCM10007907_28540 [Chitinimonas prasina]|uniref:LPS export ABC transporter periplasmic protein LptC n=1 Tax=Chitinimonas prasina TaxID=1434937 RepID=A0ABQ5YHC4_9NEIS|nr:LPS export ABC transporter periplasmic protein LptC [Chitinimonas prasina]GLR14064.1 hypothetical protein GCM10007907_28540 [Chitinimonas prasina]